MKKIAVTSPSQSINVLGIGVVLSLLGDSTLYTVLPDPSIWSRLGLSLTWVGVLLGVNRVVRLLTNLWAGNLYDRLNRRVLLIGSLLLGAACNVVYAFSFGPIPFLIGRVLWGAAWSGIWVGGNTVILDLSTEASRGRYSGHFQMWFFLGAAAGALAGGAFTDAFGFRGGLLLSASLATLGAVLWFLALPETRPVAGFDPSRGGSWRQIPLARAVVAAIPVVGIRFVFAGVLAATTILWLQMFIGREVTVLHVVIPLASATGAFSAARMLASVLGAPLSGLVSDRLGKRWPVVAASMGASAMGLWLMGGSAIGLAIAGAIVAAAGAGSVQALVPALIGDQIMEEQRSRSLSVVYTLGDIASALGPPTALTLLNVLGLPIIYRISGALLGALALIALSLTKGEAAGSIASS